jgi:hypothetical protein
MNTKRNTTNICRVCGDEILEGDLATTEELGAAPKGYTVHRECLNDALGLLRIAFWRKYLVAQLGARVAEYINEAQHQDGYAYWMQFDTVEEVVADARLYFEG